MFKRRKFGGDSGLESRLRELRAEARDEFVADVTATVSARPVGRRVGSRVAFASAVAVFILGTFASFGGLGYAASGAAGTYHAVKKVAVGKGLYVHKSAARSQYSSPKETAKPKVTQAGVAGVQQRVQSGVKSSGTLPFTGISLASTLLLSLVLIASGIVLRRRERRQG